MKLEFGRLHMMLKCALKKQLAGLNTSARSFQQVSSGRCGSLGTVGSFHMHWAGAFVLKV